MPEPTVLKGAIVDNTDNNLRLTQNLVGEMISLAEKGEAERKDTGCGILYGVILDSAYRIKKLVDDEKRKHGL